MTQAQTTVGDYLLHRLKQLGADHIFGVPGDFSLGFCSQIEKSPVKWIGTCNELNAAYAADGYARMRGIGAVSVTYGVGEFSALNGIAGAFAERIPVVILVGCPTRKNLKLEPRLHHTVGQYNIPRKVFKKLTVASGLIDDPSTAPQRIDEILQQCLLHQGPGTLISSNSSIVYMCIPADVNHEKCEGPKGHLPSWEHHPSFNLKSDKEALDEAVTEAANMINSSKSPVVIGGLELIRYRFQQLLDQLLRSTGMPYVTMMLGKTVLGEDHPQFLGLYEGDISRKEVKQCVHSSDCVVMLGELKTDFNTGGFTADIQSGNLIEANFQELKIKNHIYSNVYLHHFIEKLIPKLHKRGPEILKCPKASEGCTHRPSHFSATSDRLTCHRFFDRMSSYIPKNAVVVAETGKGIAQELIV